MELVRASIQTMALYRGIPVDLLHTRDVSLWLVIPIAFNPPSTTLYPSAVAFSIALAIQVFTLSRISFGSCSTHLPPKSQTSVNNFQYFFLQIKVETLQTGNH